MHFRDGRLEDKDEDDHIADLAEMKVVVKDAWAMLNFVFMIVYMASFCVAVLLDSYIVNDNRRWAGPLVDEWPVTFLFLGVFTPIVVFEVGKYRRRAYGIDFLDGCLSNDELQHYMLQWSAVIVVTAFGTVGMGFWYWVYTNLIAVLLVDFVVFI